jgi:hypothetical protein
MIKLSLQELKQIQRVCREAGTEYFTLDRNSSSGIGSTLTLTYETFVADYPAQITVEITNMDSW